MNIKNRLLQRARKLENEVVVISLALKDKRTPLIAKICIGVTISYAVSPIDIIPDFIPVLGYLDDLLIIPLLLTLSIKLIPPELLADCRRQVTDGYRVNKLLGVPATVIIIMLWLGLLALVVFNIVLRT